MTHRNEYAEAGVDYKRIDPFKAAMREIARRTRCFPARRGVVIPEGVTHVHGGLYRYQAQPYMVCQVTEGLGNKNVIAEWMYANSGTGRTYADSSAWDTVMMAVNDVIAQGALPVVYTDEVAAGDDAWFTDAKRAADFAEGMYEACSMAEMALIAGESPALKYLVKNHPVLSGTVTGVVPIKQWLVTGNDLAVGDIILGAASTGLHCNGISLVIKRADTLPENFLTKLPNGNTFGEEALIRTRCYVELVETLLTAGVRVHAFLPGTGSGIAKVAYDKRPYTYRIHTWVPEIPPLFQFLMELGVDRETMVHTYNMGVGYYIYLPPEEVDLAMEVADDIGFPLYELGRVEEGERQTIFEPWDMVLPPPEE